MKQAKLETTAKPGLHEAGFTLVEAMISIVILVFGLVAVTNLLIVAGSSSQVANAGTAAAALAQEQMEILKATPFQNLVPSGAGTLDNDTAGYFRIATVAPSGPPLTGLVNAADNTRLRVPGAGNVRVRWLIDPIDARTFYIVVRAEAIGALVATRSRAEYRTFRACTAPVPNAGVCAPNAIPCCPP